jgi:hypothetical protein
MKSERLITRLVDGGAIQKMVIKCSPFAQKAHMTYQNEALCLFDS